MPPTIIIQGFSSTYKLPGFFAETVYGAGAITVGDIPLVCLVVGNKGSSGTAVADQDVVQILGINEADTQLQAGYEITQMAYMGLLEAGVLLYAAPNAEAGGAVAGTATLTFAGTATASGQWTVKIDGRVYTGGIANGDTPTTSAAAVVAAISADSRSPVTAGNVAGVVTFTRKSKGVRGNDGSVYLTKGSTAETVATGQTATIAGGTAMTGGGVHFTGGTGTDSLTTVLSVLFPGTYDRIAFAQYDTTNAAAIVSQLNTKAGVLEGRLEHALIGVTGSFSAATTLATTTLNAHRVQLMWYIDGPQPGSMMAARFSAKRTATEQSDPCAAYDGAVLTGIVPQVAPSASPSNATQVSALNNGVTPVKTENGQAKVVRSITSHSLDGALPDYRTLDTSDAYVPDFVRKSLALLWLTEFLPANPRVADDPPAGAKEPPTQVGTPSKWKQRATKLLKELEEGTATTPPVLQQVDANPIAAGWDNTAKRIMSAVPVIPASNQHQIGVSVRQLSPS